MHGSRLLGLHRIKGLYLRLKQANPTWSSEAGVSNAGELRTFLSRHGRAADVRVVDGSRAVLGTPGPGARGSPSGQGGEGGGMEV